MGYQRLMSWSFKPAEISLGTYIYESASGQDPIYRLGMLYFFENKNIRHKPARAQLFHDYGDAVSEHDMDFDWADETMHAGYGRHWLRELLVLRGQDLQWARANPRTLREISQRLRQHRDTAGSGRDQRGRHCAAGRKSRP